MWLTGLLQGGLLQDSDGQLSPPVGVRGVDRRELPLDPASLPVGVAVQRLVGVVLLLLQRLAVVVLSGTLSARRDLHAPFPPTSILLTAF